MKSIELFPVTIFKTKAGDNDILKKTLVEDILKNADSLIIPEDWTTNKLITSFSGEPVGREVIKKNRELLDKTYLNCAKDIFDKEIEIKFNSMWYNVYRDGEYQEEHDHLGSIFRPSHFSFIHLLCFDKKNHQPPEFRDPLSQLRHLSLELDSNHCGEFHRADVEEGDVLMFPSYLHHSVPVGKKTEYPRITISFNCVVNKYGEEVR
jgi:hypothetical protein